MRKLIVLLFLAICSGIMANPLIPQIIGQIWFNDQSELMLEFGDMAYIAANMDMSISDGVTSSIYTLTEESWTAYPFVINLSESMPDLSFNPNQGELILQEELHICIYEHVKWGNSADCDVSPIVGSETVYQYDHQDYWWGEGISVRSWAKAAQYQDHIWHSMPCCSNLDLTVQNLSGTPLVNIPIVHQEYYTPLGYTDEFGKLNVALPSQNTLLRIFLPEVAEAAFNQNFFAEVGQTYTFTAILDYTSNVDPALVLPAIELCLKPSVLSPGKSMQIDCDAGLSQNARLELFDVKGRKLDSIPYNGHLDWQAPRLSSGIYFLRLQDGGKTLDTTRFILRK